MSLSSKNKICTKAQYSYVFKSKNKLKSTSFNLYWCKSETPHAMLGVSVAKKNVAKAVTRNKYKRLIRESFRLKKNDMSSLNLVITLKKEALQKSSNSFVEELNTKWEQLVSYAR